MEWIKCVHTEMKRRAGRNKGKNKEREREKRTCKQTAKHKEQEWWEKKRCMTKSKWIASVRVCADENGVGENHRSLSTEHQTNQRTIRWMSQCYLTRSPLYISLGFIVFLFFFFLKPIIWCCFLLISFKLFVLLCTISWINLALFCNCISD